MINKIGIIGAGTMSQGISYLLAKKGVEVFIWNHRSPERVFRIIENILKSKIDKNEMMPADKDKILFRLHPANDLEQLGNVDGIIECVSEDYSVKKAIFKKLGIFKDIRFLATNTSGLSVSKLAGYYFQPEKVIGLHFFNPPTRLEFIEIITGKRTDGSVVKECRDFCEQIKMGYVIIPDSTGSVVNRLLCAMMNEAARIYNANQGKVPVFEIDNAMVKGAAFPIGPFALADLIGIDICLSMLSNFKKRFYGKTFAPDKIWKKMAVNKELGKKSKKGFYQY